MLRSSLSETSADESNNETDSQNRQSGDFSFRNEDSSDNDDDSDDDPGKLDAFSASPHGSGGLSFTRSSSYEMSRKRKYSADESFARKSSSEDNFMSDNDSDFSSNSATDSSVVGKKLPSFYEDSNKSSPPPKKKFHFSKDGLSNYVRTKDTPIGKDNKGRAMMEKMGYTTGKGLGREAQGRVEPVEMSNQRGRRGLGLKLKGLDPANLEWNSSLEVVKIVEEVKWLPGGHLPPLDLQTLRSWKQEGRPNLDYKSMTDFCDPSLHQEIFDGKSVFDHLSSEEMYRARTRSNPFETLRSGMFLNRAALKMANIDSAFDFMFTSPKDEDGIPVLDKDQLLYFADVCAGPGGFSEYVLWRTKWRSKGFGFTLKGDCDFRICDFYVGPPETFEAYYGVKDDGNIYDPDNIESLRQYVMESTDNEGVHFMMADGGFSVDGKEDLQEILSKRLYLCQCLTALSIVRPNGHFVCKFFDIFTPFSAGILYLMYRSFKSVCIFKPNTSRPANSERYIVCKFKREDSETIRDYLFEVNERLNELDSSDTDISHVVPLSELTNDHDFFDYLYESNNLLGQRQAVNLLKISSFCRDPNLIETKQADFRRECLKQWKVPDKARAAPRIAPDEAIYKILGPDRKIFMECKLNPLKDDNLENHFKSIYDWNCYPVESEQLHFYLGLGRNKFFKFNPKDANWIKEDVACSPELSPGTLVYGEIVHELIGEGRSQQKHPALHVIDGISIAFEKIIDLPYKERLKMLNLYAKAVSKTRTKRVVPLRIKQPVPFEDINSIFEGLTYRLTKSGGTHLVIENDQYVFHPKGVLFTRIMKEPWMRCLSSKNLFYCFNLKNGKSQFEYDAPQNAYASTTDTLQNLHMWKWEEGVGLQREGPVEGVLHKNNLLNFIRNKSKN